MKSCDITFENLADYNDGCAASAVAEQISQHLKTGCNQCRENLAWMQDTMTTLKAAENVVVPQSIASRAHTVFTERFRAPIRHSWFAFLQFDSRSSMMAMAGARGGQADSYQLIYSTDAHDIELFQEPSEDGKWYIIGQVMPKEGETTLVTHEVILKGADQESLTFPCRSDEFHLTSVPAGIYDITLRLSEEEITLSSVSVGQQASA